MSKRATAQIPTMRVTRARTSDNFVVTAPVTPGILPDQLGGGGNVLILWFSDTYQNPTNVIGCP